MFPVLFFFAAGFVQIPLRGEQPLPSSGLSLPGKSALRNN
jgi:hypothetical protein